LYAEKLAAAKADFMKMEAESIIRRSSSPWASILYFPSLSLIFPSLVCFPID
jgi:hypothetical protein